MFQMKIAKLMFKFNNQMLPDSFYNYFIKLDSVHRYDTRQKSIEYFQPFASSESGKITLQQI